jgi:hypothetical protein
VVVLDFAIIEPIAIPILGLKTIVAIPAILDNLSLGRL